jgi:hypothetical protein
MTMTIHNVSLFAFVHSRSSPRRLQHLISHFILQKYTLPGTYLVIYICLLRIVLSDRYIRYLFGLVITITQFLPIIGTRHELFFYFWMPAAGIQHCSVSLNKTRHLLSLLCVCVYRSNIMWPRMQQDSN